MERFIILSDGKDVLTTDGTFRKFNGTYKKFLLFTTEKEAREYAKTNGISINEVGTEHRKQFFPSAGTTKVNQMAKPQDMNKLLLSLMEPMHTEMGYQGDKGNAIEKVNIYKEVWYQGGMWSFYTDIIDITATGFYSSSKQAPTAKLSRVGLHKTGLGEFFFHLPKDDELRKKYGF